MKTTIISIIFAAVLIGGVSILSKKGDPGYPPEEAVNNVSLIEGKQVIEIRAKGGYFPSVTTAQAGIPTIIKVTTDSTFDCSSALVIPGIGYRDYLPPSGTTEIEVPAQTSGTDIRGLCSMGMYNFMINFR